MKTKRVLITDSNRLKGFLMRRFFLRFHMFLILTATFLTGILVSKILLTFNVNNMIIRFPIAILFSYAGFFGFMKLWLLYLSSSATGSRPADNICDAGDIISLPGHSTSQIPDPVCGGGGQFGGGGASGSFDVGDRVADAAGSAVDGCGDAVADAAGEAASGIFEEGGIVLIILGALLAIVFGAGIYLIYEAPVILSEAAFEFLLAASLVKGMKRLEDPDWMQSVLRTTIIPFAMVLFMALLVAAAVKTSYPTAIKLSEAVRLMFAN